MINIDLTKVPHKEDIILLGLRGSLAHGTYISPENEFGTDDIDLMGVVVPPIDRYMGLRNFGSRGTLEIKSGDYDIVLYEAKKFIGLLLQGNPNVLSLLWNDPSTYYICTPSATKLIENRWLFLGKHMHPAFMGYAQSQREKMIKGTDNGHMGEKRKELRKIFGYDTKHASHLIRLLRMFADLLETGEIQVARSDAQDFIDIKTGKWSLGRVVAESESLENLIQQRMETTNLPERPDRDKINRLCVDVIAGELLRRNSGNYHRTDC